MYILASRRNGTLYIRVTSSLAKRVREHQHDQVEGFITRYRVHRLVYHEVRQTMESAISREKQLKKCNRAGSAAS